MTILKIPIWAGLGKEIEISLMPLQILNKSIGPIIKKRKGCIGTLNAPKSKYISSPTSASLVPFDPVFVDLQGLDIPISY